MRKADDIIFGLGYYPSKKGTQEGYLIVEAMNKNSRENSIEFAEWIEKKMWCKSTDTRFPQSYGLWYNKPNPDIPREECLTTDELYNLFLSEVL